MWWYIDYGWVILLFRYHDWYWSHYSRYECFMILAMILAILHASGNFRTNHCHPVTLLQGYVIASIPLQSLSILGLGNIVVLAIYRDILKVSLSWCFVIYYCDISLYVIAHLLPKNNKPTHLVVNHKLPVKRYKHHKP